MARASLENGFSRLPVLHFQRRWLAILHKPFMPPGFLMVLELHSGKLFLYSDLAQEQTISGTLLHHKERLWQALLPGLYGVVA